MKNIVIFGAPSAGKGTQSDFIIEKYGLLKLLNRSQIFSHLYLVFIVMISFVIFDNTVIAEGLQRIGWLFGVGGIAFSSASTMFYLKDFAVILIIAMIGATQWPMKLVQKAKEGKGAGMIRTAEPFFNAALLILATAFLINGSFNPFLYFRF